MKILLINQCFYPDVVSSGQHLTDLALELIRHGHAVTVLAGRRGYDNPKLRFAKKETWKDVSIIRIPSTGLGKGSRFCRAIDFGSFFLSCFARMLILPKFDAVVALTSPPLISFLAALFAIIKRERFYFWIMDLNPDEAIAAGWLQKNSTMAKLLSALLKFSAGKARKLIVLDRFMRERMLAKGVAPEKIMIVPPWSHDEHAFYNPKGRKAFRAGHGLADKFVVMYSGNHSPCHPLDTLLQAANQLQNSSNVHFLFIGGGSEFGKAKAFANQKALSNIDFLPYQPLDKLAETLSSADLHVVVMGNPFAGIVHPCKIYNILSIGSPFLYIGPEESHIEDLIRSLGKGCDAYSARHGDVQSVSESILEAQRKMRTGGQSAFRELARCYSETSLLPQMIESLECASSATAQPAIIWDCAKMEVHK
jgi:colanic acid biosynthesis glycosyl transferase WcaI